ncbi:hypothetical protein BAC1_00002 [uncultured bacterium]|nr:hypothetical protein BAC1_00002 [uncultured bacterium]
MDKRIITERDVFISYASEDRATVAKPIAELLTGLGIRVWFDQYELKVGDSLIQKLDEGLSKCKYGIVILSHSFFEKYFTKHELAGLIQREVNCGKVILPVWVGINETQIRQYSPSLADRIAARWDEGIETVVVKLIEVIKPEAIDALFKRHIVALQELTTGNEVLEVVVGCHFSYRCNDDPRDETEINLIGGFLQELSDFNDVWDDVSITSRMQAAVYVSELLAELKKAGWNVYGTKMNGKKKVAGVESEWVWCAIAVLRDTTRKPIFMDDKFYLLKVD